MLFYSYLPNEPLSKERVEAFSDGVYAIVATLLILDIWFVALLFLLWSVWASVAAAHSEWDMSLLGHRKVLARWTGGADECPKVTPPPTGLHNCCRKCVSSFASSFIHHSSEHLHVFS